MQDCCREGIYDIMKLIGTTYEGEPAVKVMINNNNVVKIYVNKTSMSMFRFMQWVANDNGHGMVDYLDGQTAVCY